MKEKKRKSLDGVSIFLMGPTASGKSQIALRVAESFNAEIVNADSMQVYRGLDIGVAKPSDSERLRIRHHLVDILDISEKLDAFKYKRLAEAAGCEIRKRGRIPLFVGGSGLYLKLLIDGVEPPPADPALAARLSEEYSGDEGFEKLSEFLSKKSVEGYRRTYPNRRRMLKAAERIILGELGEKPAAKQGREYGNENGEIRKLSFVLSRKREDLRSRIIARTDQMLENGWLREAEAMIRKGLLNSPTARQAVGYGIIARRLAGQIAFDAMRKEIISSTCRLARKQESWFRNKHRNAIRINLPENENLLFEILKTRLVGGFNLEA